MQGKFIHKQSEGKHYLLMNPILLTSKSISLLDAHVVRGQEAELPLYSACCSVPHPSPCIAMQILLGQCKCSCMPLVRGRVALRASGGTHPSCQGLSMPYNSMHLHDRESKSD